MRIAAMTLGLALFGQVAVAQGPGMRRQELQQQVVQRFMQNVRAQAGLSDDQFERFGKVTRESFSGRAEIARRELSLWRALEGRMAPDQRRGGTFIPSPPPRDQFRIRDIHGGLLGRRHIVLTFHRGGS